MTVYEQIGEKGFTALVATFYRRVDADPVLRPIYPEADLSGAESRLRLFLIQFFGGPATYSYIFDGYTYVSMPQSA